MVIQQYEFCQIISDHNRKLCVCSHNSCWLFFMKLVKPIRCITWNEKIDTISMYGECSNQWIYCRGNSYQTVFFQETNNLETIFVSSAENLAKLFLKATKAFYEWGNLNQFSGISWKDNHKLCKHQLRRHPVIEKNFRERFGVTVYVQLWLFIESKFDRYLDTQQKKQLECNFHNLRATLQENPYHEKLFTFSRFTHCYGVFCKNWRSTVFHWDNRNNSAKCRRYFFPHKWSGIFSLRKFFS